MISLARTEMWQFQPFPELPALKYQKRETERKKEKEKKEKKRKKSVGREIKLGQKRKLV